MRRRLGAAAAMSALANLGLVLLLSWLQGGGEGDGAPPPTLRFHVVTPPEPEPPPEPVPPERVPEQAVQQSRPQAMPALDLPPLPSSGEGVALPRVDELLGGFELPLGAPAYAAAPPAAPAGPADEPAQLLAQPVLSRYYPRRATQQGIEGRSLLELRIDAAGRIAAVRVLESEPPGVFERAAQQVARRLQYRPAVQGGRPAASTVRLELTWDLDQ